MDYPLSIYVGNNTNDQSRMLHDLYVLEYQ